MVALGLQRAAGIWPLAEFWIGSCFRAGSVWQETDVRVRLGRVISDELIRSSGNISLKAADVRGFCLLGRRRVRTDVSFLMRHMENRVDGMQRTCGAPVFVMFLAFAFAANLRAQTPTEAAHGEAQSQTVPATAQGQADDYAIGPDDVLNVYILDVAELSREYRVSSAGTVTFRS